MRLAYITGDICPNGNFSFYHDLLTNFIPTEGTRHRVYLVAPNWNEEFVQKLKDRNIEVRSCFKSFHDSEDEWWNKILKDTEDCDVLISGNITNLDEVVPDRIKIPVVSVSLAEKGYLNQHGTYGSFYKPRFHKAAVSETAKLAFPEHVRGEVTAIHSGIDTSRLTQQVDREDIRKAWFPENAEHKKLVLFVGAHQKSKGVDRAIKCLEHLPKEYHLIVLTDQPIEVPPDLSRRVSVCKPTYHVADIYQACDCLVLPTEHEGFSMSLLEAWHLMIPVVTTKHKTIEELQRLHPGVSFGHHVPITHETKELATVIQQAEPDKDAASVVRKHYMANHMVDRWKDYLTEIIKERN